MMIDPKLEPKDSPVITWTPTKLGALKREYYRYDPEDHLRVFQFEGHDIMVGYAKYLIQYLEMRFEATQGRRFKQDFKILPDV